MLCAAEKNGLHSKGKYPRKRQDHGRQLAPVFGEVRRTSRGLALPHTGVTCHGAGNLTPAMRNTGDSRSWAGHVGTFGYRHRSKMWTGNFLPCAKRTLAGIFIDRESGRDFNRPRYRIIERRLKRNDTFCRRNVTGGTQIAPNRIKKNLDTLDTPDTMVQVSACMT